MTPHPVQTEKALLDRIDAYLKPLKCFVTRSVLDDSWHIVDCDDARVLGIITDLQDFARSNGITLD